MIKPFNENDKKNKDFMNQFIKVIGETLQKKKLQNQKKK